MYLALAGADVSLRFTIVRLRAGYSKRILTDNEVGKGEKWKSDDAEALAIGDNRPELSTSRTVQLLIQ